MKLYKALKARKKLVGEIVKLKDQIKTKNSYLAGSSSADKFEVDKVYAELQAKVNELIGLKFIINEANHPIQEQIYRLSEAKAMIVFWNEVSVVEGLQSVGYSDTIKDYKVHYDEAKRNEIVAGFQKKVDAIQDEIDNFNYTTDIPWGDASEDLQEVEETPVTGPDKEEVK